MTIKTLFLFAIIPFQLNQCLRVSGILGDDSGVTEHIDDMILFRRNAFQYRQGTFGIFRQVMILAISEHHRGNGIDKDNIQSFVA